MFKKYEGNKRGRSDIVNRLPFFLFQQRGGEQDGKG